MRPLQKTWAIIIICSALAALGAMLVFPGSSIRPFVIAWFLFICPGMAIVRLFRLKELLARLILALALSFSIDGLIAGVYLYADHWSPLAIMFTLALFSIGTVIVERTNAHRMLYQRVAFIQRLAALLTHPLVIGTNTTQPQSIDAMSAALHIEEEPTVHMVNLQTIAAHSSHIEETPTIQLAKPTLPPALNKDAAIEETPTIQLAMPTPPHALNKDAAIEEMPTMHMSSTSVTQPTPPPDTNKDTAIEEMPTIQMARPTPPPALNKDAATKQPPTMTDQLDFDTPEADDIEQKSTVLMPDILPPRPSPLQSQNAKQTPAQPQAPIRKRRAKIVPMEK
jgi:hypothetical protein